MSAWIEHNKEYINIDLIEKVSYDKTQPNYTQTTPKTWRIAFTMSSGSTIAFIDLSQAYPILDKLGLPHDV